MSRTDKTRPHWVKAEDHKILYPRATAPMFWPDRYWLGEMKCGCEMCTEQSYRKRLARRERYAGKKYARDWGKEY